MSTVQKEEEADDTESNLRRSDVRDVSLIKVWLHEINSLLFSEFESE